MNLPKVVYWTGLALLTTVLSVLILPVLTSTRAETSSQQSIEISKQDSDKQRPKSEYHNSRDRNSDDDDHEKSEHNGEREHHHESDRGYSEKEHS